MRQTLSPLKGPAPRNGERATPIQRVLSEECIESIPKYRIFPQSLLDFLDGGQCELQIESESHAD